VRLYLFAGQIAKRTQGKAQGTHQGWCIVQDEKKNTAGVDGRVPEAVSKKHVMDHHACREQW
jgi:hypothetical protein